MRRRRITYQYERIKTFKKKGLKGVIHIVATSSVVDGRNIFKVLAEYAGGLKDWPIRYADKSIAYGYPGRIPKYVKELVEQAFDELDIINALTRT